MTFQSYYNQIIVTHLNEKCIQCRYTNPSLILSGSIKNFKSKNTILQTLYSLELMCGSRPQLTKSKVSVAAFQLKKNSLLGFKINLRSVNFFGFLERLSLTVLPRSKDFQGFKSQKNIFSNSYMLGFPNLNIFLEMDTQYHLFKNELGMNLQFSNSKLSTMQLMLILTHYQIPFLNEKS